MTINALFVVPARYNSVRLPQKMLADIAGLPLICHAARRVREAAEATGADYVVAVDHDDVRRTVANDGHPVVMTDPALPSGTDRCFAACQLIAAARGADTADTRSDDTAESWTHVINVQGDMPFIDPAQLIFLAQNLHRCHPVNAKGASPIKRMEGDANAAHASKDHPAVDMPPANILTLAAPLQAADWNRSSVVKIMTGLAPQSSAPSNEPHDDRNWARAHAFSRSPVPCPETHGDGVAHGWEHLGVYAYHYTALRAFVALSPSPIEQAERLEQWRAIEAGMAIDVGRVDHAPIAIDTPDDLDRARGMAA